jgi:hypothetical protein
LFDALRQNRPYRSSFLILKTRKATACSFVATTKTLEATPQSGLGVDDQPLSMKAACKIALDAGMRRFPKTHGISFESLKFLRNVFEYPAGRLVTWFYVISIKPVFPEYTSGPPTDIVILLDGKVIDPTPMK